MTRPIIPSIHGHDHAQDGPDPVAFPIGAWCSFENVTADQTAASGAVTSILFPDAAYSYGMEEAGWTASWLTSAGHGFFRLTPDSPVPEDDTRGWMIGTTLRCSAATRPGGQAYIHINTGGRFGAMSFQGIASGYPNGQTLTTPPIFHPWPEDPDVDSIRISVEVTLFQNTGHDWTVLKNDGSFKDQTVIWAYRVV